MKIRLSIVSLLTSLTILSPAYGDIDVTPDPTVPGLQLDALHTEPPSDSADNPTAVTDPTDPIDQLTCYESANGNCNTGEDFTTGPPIPAEPRPEPTEGDILRATRTIGLPRLQVKVQPGDTTLVNIPTVLYAEPQPFMRNVTLLGYQVDLAAEPVSYRWWHGDGTDQTTSTPGKPYPAMDVTHRYARPATDVRPRVDVTYQVRYRIDDGPWRTISQTLTATGPVAELEVAEAAPVLTRR